MYFLSGKNPLMTQKPLMTHSGWDLTHRMYTVSAILVQFLIFI